jgi:hypothetical protein
MGMSMKPEGQFLATITTLGFLLASASSAVEATEIFDIAKANNPRAAGDRQGHVHAVFEGFYSNGNIRDILYSGSNDGGRTWTEPTNVSSTPGVSSEPDVAVEENGSIDVVWRDTTSGELSPDIYFSRSTDGGHSWSKALDISNTPGVCSNPAIALGPDGSMHVVWRDTSLHQKPSIFYSGSTNGGKSFSKYQNISPTPGISSEPAVAVDLDGMVHAAWLDTTSGEERPDIFYVRRPAAGSWTKPIDVSNSERISAHPALACGPKGRVFLCWRDNSRKENAADIWCAIAGRSGEFGKPLNISGTPGVSSQPFVTADVDGRVAIVWSDTTSGDSRPDIYARVSTDNGSDFSNVMDVTNTTGVSRYPCAVLAGPQLIVVWEEVTGTLSTAKSTSINIKEIATGPVDEVDPTIHRSFSR